MVVYHFQHFAAIGQAASSWSVDSAALPFSSALKIVYLYGWMAVDFFFVISGFVFFWLYREQIFERKVNAWSFAVLRFTRLYPLHFVTLLCVGALQTLYRPIAGSPFIIPHNDATHFLLNVLFIQSWGFERGPSFNAASWSISVEVLLYLIFFVVSLSRMSRSPLVVLGAVCIGLLLQGLNPVIGRGIAGFFAGGLAYYALQTIVARPDRKKLTWGIIGLTAAIWFVVVVAIQGDVLEHGFAAVGWERWTTIAGKISGRFILYVLFPLTVIALTTSERVLNCRWTLGPLLGDISYAAYLIHFPLQLFVANLVVRDMLPSTAVTGPVALFAFLATLIALSWLTYRYFELPMQRFGRRILLARRDKFA
ncbi:acyltransferase [Methylobacterium sp. NFXW15]